MFGLSWTIQRCNRVHGSPIRGGLNHLILPGTPDILHLRSASNIVVSKVEYFTLCQVATGHMFVIPLLPVGSRSLNPFLGTVKGSLEGQLMLLQLVVECTPSRLLYSAKEKIHR